MVGASIMKTEIAMRYRVEAANSAGVIATGPMNMTTALRRAVQFRDQGFHSIRIVDPVTGVKAELDGFMIDPPQAPAH